MNFVKQLENVDFSIYSQLGGNTTLVLEDKKDTGEVLISIPDDGKEMMVYSSFSQKNAKLYLFINFLLWFITHIAQYFILLAIYYFMIQQKQKLIDCCMGL